MWTDYSCLVLVLSTCLVLALEAQAVPLASPKWPTSFFTEFNESWRSGVYAVDLNHVDSVTGITGAELSVHSFGHQDPVCSALRPNTPCTQVAVGGQRYIVWAASPVDQCCRCCSWAEGCGPTLMVQNATYEGQRAVDGQVCTSPHIGASWMTCCSGRTTLSHVG